MGMYMYVFARKHIWWVISICGSISIAFDAHVTHMNLVGYINTWINLNSHIGLLHDDLHIGYFLI